MGRKKKLKLDWPIEASYYMRRFGFTAEDLAANRLGKKSPAQKSRIRRQGRLQMVIIAAACAVALLIFEAGAGGGEKNDFTLIAAIGGALLLLVSVLAFRSETRPVSCTEGLPSLQFTFGLTWVRYLAVGDKMIKLQKRMLYMPIPQDEVFCVYYDKDTNQLLSMEPRSERNRIVGVPRHR